MKDVQIEAFLDELNRLEQHNYSTDIADGLRRLRWIVERAKPQSTPLTLNELAIGEVFTFFPSDGDDSGHGGYRACQNVFEKITPVSAGIGPPDNVRNIETNTSSHWPGNVEVIRLNTRPVTKRPLWRCRDGQLVPIADMDDQHLQYTERAIEAGTAPATEDDRANITAERERRGLKKLKPMKEVRAKIAQALTQLISFYRPGSKSDRVHVLRGLGLFLRETVAPAVPLGKNAPDEGKRHEVLVAADLFETLQEQDVGDGRFDTPPEVGPAHRLDTSPEAHEARRQRFMRFMNFMQNGEEIRVLTVEEAAAFQKQWEDQWPEVAEIIKRLTPDIPIKFPVAVEMKSWVKKNTSLADLAKAFGTDP